MGVAKGYMGIIIRCVDMGFQTPEDCLEGTFLQLLANPEMTRSQANGEVQRRQVILMLSFHKL